ncbi:MAG: MarR family transcriptional regulator [Ottowia sp.]|uniref:MarR family winged helix-turn-helix transcriptional regulator n=1 Tax=Ottowia sp. TaxID=1898956 RepID=UPI0039E684F3
MRPPSSQTRSQDGELRMQELAALLGLNQSSVSRMVERQERAGLTVRDLFPDDKRGVYTVLTEQGRACVGRRAARHEQALGAALKAHGGAALLPPTQARKGRTGP